MHIKHFNLALSQETNRTYTEISSSMTPPKLSKNQVILCLSLRSYREKQEILSPVHHVTQLSTSSNFSTASTLHSSDRTITDKINKPRLVCLHSDRKILHLG